MSNSLVISLPKSAVSTAERKLKDNGMTMTVKTSQNKSSKISPPERRTKRRRASNLLGVKRGPAWLSTVAGSYLRSLNDPFQYDGVRLGYNTMVPTELATLYFRGVATCNSDGSWSAIALPAPQVSGQAPVLNNPNGIGSTIWNVGPYSNAAAVSPIMNEFRVVSIGLRALPLVAAVSIPGIAYAGSIPITNFDNAAVMTSSALAALPTSVWSNSNDGVTVVGRPIDNASFEFRAFTQPTSVNLPFSAPYVTFQGLPTGTRIIYEVCFNIEGIRDFTIGGVSAINAHDSANSSGPTVSDYFPTFESAWKTLRGYLDNPASFTSDLDAASQITGAVGYAGAALATGLGIHMFRGPGRARLRQ